MKADTAKVRMRIRVMRERRTKKKDRLRSVVYLSLKNVVGCRDRSLGRCWTECKGRTGTLYGSQNFSRTYFVVNVLFDDWKSKCCSTRVCPNTFTHVFDENPFMFCLSFKQTCLTARGLNSRVRPHGMVKFNLFHPLFSH